MHAHTHATHTHTETGRLAGNADIAERRIHRTCSLSLLPPFAVRCESTCLKVNLIFLISLDCRRKQGRKEVRKKEEDLGLRHMCVQSEILKCDTRIQLQLAHPLPGAAAQQHVARRPFAPATGLQPAIRLAAMIPALSAARR